jgi:hypothetical protein
MYASMLYSTHKGLITHLFLFILAILNFIRKSSSMSSESLKIIFDQDLLS